MLQDAAPVENTPLVIQFFRELTAPQTLRFFVVVALLVLVAYLVMSTKNFDTLRDPFMLVVGTMFEPVLARLSPAGK